MLSSGMPIETCVITGPVAQFVCVFFSLPLRPRKRRPKLAGRLTTCAQFCNLVPLRSSWVFCEKRDGTGDKHPWRTMSWKCRRRGDEIDCELVKATSCYLVQAKFLRPLKLIIVTGVSFKLGLAQFKSVQSKIQCNDFYHRPSNRT